MRYPLFLLVLLSGGLSAQDLTTPLLSHSWQATFTNPALYGQGRGRLTVGLPGVSNDLVAENVTYNELLLTENGRRILDLGRLPALLETRNLLRDDFSLETVGVALRGDRLSFGLYHRARAAGAVDYPKTLAQVIVQGNAQFIGQTVEIAPAGLASSWHELGLGASFALTDQLHFGARVKYLGGIADVRTAPGGSLRLTTGEENFALTLDQDLTLNTAATVAYNGLDDIDVDYNLNRVRAEDLFSGNNGLAVDIGLFARLGSVRLQVAANDLAGRIDWSDDVTNFRLTGTSSFSGLDVLEQVFQDSVSFNDAVDSLRTAFEPTESSAPYQTTLAPTYLVGGEYDVTDRLTAGVLVMHYDRSFAPETAFALSARYAVLDELTVGLNYNARRAAPANLGLHLLAEIGPLNLLATTDNLLTVFRQRDSSRASVRLGASLSFGVSPPRSAIRPVPLDQ